MFLWKAHICVCEGKNTCVWRCERWQEAAVGCQDVVKHKVGTVFNYYVICDVSQPLQNGTFGQNFDDRKITFGRSKADVQEVDELLLLRMSHKSRNHRNRHRIV